MNTIKKPTVSVVIPTHNRRHYLEEAIASVFAQSFTDWQLIVVDDRSEDDTWAWLSTLTDSRVKKIRLLEHGERSRARNTGLQAAEGDFILFLDDDDLLPESVLKLHTEALKKHPGAVASIGGYLAFDEKGGTTGNRLVRRLRVQNVWYDIMFGWMATAGQCLFRKRSIEDINGWDGRYIPIEDHHFWLKVARLGPAVLLPHYALKFRVHGGQWRLAQTWKLATKIRKQAVKTVPKDELGRAKQILQARTEFRHAMQHNAQGEILKALPLFLKTIRIAPYILQSPLARSVFFVPFVRCFIGGKPGYERLQKLVKRKRSDFSVQQIVEADKFVKKLRREKNEAVEDLET